MKLIWQACCKVDAIDARKLAELPRTHLRIHWHLTVENCRTALTDLYGKAGQAWLQAVALSPMGHLQVDLLLELVDTLDARIRRLDDRVKRLLKKDPVAQRLQTWPGIGPFGAALLLAEIGTIDRLRSSHELAACAGLRPSTQSSGDKTRHGSVGRAGRPRGPWASIDP